MVTKAVADALEMKPEEERLLIRDITIAAEAQVKEGDTFYLINHRWWQQWLDYVNQDMGSNTSNGPSYASNHHESFCSGNLKRPSSIDNYDLIDNDNDDASEISNVEMELHDTLVEGRDYILLPEEVWEKLHGWYGGGPILPRKAISSGLSRADLAIEVYPLRLQLLLSPRDERAIVRISKKETVAELHRKVCEVFDLIPDQVCIWDYYNYQKHVLMDDMEKTLDDANIQMDQFILVEVLKHGNSTALYEPASPMEENGSMEKDSVSLTTEPCSTMVTRGAPSGLTGLLNLGNTCFMNSAIQCLVHTPEFARYFQEDYSQEINWQNPLGMVGELALAFGELLRKLWAPGRTPVSPRPFKTKLARFAPQFSGYSQHDCQELLAFLLDGLHEDLNRVKHKPYIKTKDADGRPDEEVADEYWANHLARNDSIIVDVCQGQYKSTLVCPVCGKVSVTFDPFMYLSLPLQFASARTMTVVVFASDGSTLPTPYTVNVSKQGRCKDLIQALSNACLLKNNEKLLIAEIRDHMIHHFMDDPMILLSTIKDDDLIVAYKVLRSKSVSFLQFVHRREEMEIGSIKNSSATWKTFGTPVIAPISHEDIIRSTYVQEMAKKLLAPLLQKKEEPLSSCSSSSKAATTDLKTTTASLDSSMNGSEALDRKGTISELHLQLVSECSGCTDLSSAKEEVIKLPPLSTFSVIYINWSKKNMETYDIHYLENLPDLFKYAPAPKRSRNELLSLYTCLEAFLREEPLVPEDMWYCPRCKEQRQASKKLDLWRLPEVLVIHLKRFSFSKSAKHKLETFVNFPIHDLDLTNYVAHKNSSQRQVYELYALCNHYGTMASGHYTAYIKLLDENRWYNFDDNHISPMSEEEVKSAAAYVLFYRRVKREKSNLGDGTLALAHNLRR